MCGLRTKRELRENNGATLMLEVRGGLGQEKKVERDLSLSQPYKTGTVCQFE